MRLAWALGQWLTQRDPTDLRRALASTDARWRLDLFDAALKGTPALRLTAPACWAGTLAHLGPAPPEVALPGTLWFDATELCLHILVPAQPDQAPSWLATEPTRLFQWRAFLDHAPMERVIPQTPGDLIPFLPRDFPGPDTGAATAMTAPEARLYALWFGKALPTTHDWQNAAHLGDHRIRDMRAGAAPREWLADDTGDPVMAVAAGPDHAGIHPRGQRDLIELGTEPDPDERFVYPYLTRDPTIGLRTCVTGHLGESSELHGPTALGLQLVAKARR